MKLTVTTPTAVVLEASNVRHVRAEDETGAFGILEGHTDFITVLDVSVITWRNHSDEEHHVAVRGGVLTVHGGDTVEVATPDAVGEDTLEQLGDAVLERFRREAHAEERSRVSTARLQFAAIRQIQRYLESGRRTGPRGFPPALQAGPGGEGELP